MDLTQGIHQARKEWMMRSRSCRRLERMKNLSKEEILRAKHMQLKLKMENYLRGSR